LNKLLPLIAFSILLLVPLGAQNAFAVDIGPNNGQSGKVSIAFESPIGTSNGWDIVSEGEITHDPNAGPWEKILFGNTNTPYPKVLIEQILVGSTSEPFSDWHETIVDGTCDVWSSNAIFFGQNLPPNTDISATFSLDRKTVDWTFDPPIPAGHQFSLFKFFDCDLSVGPETGNIIIHEYPTVPTIEALIGGEIIPIEATSLLLAGAQSFSWMIPVVLSGIGIGLFVVGRKNE